MENAVIYPRYSSHGQNDMTIEGQIRICTEFAHSRGLNVIKIYPEKAKSASKDTHKRKAFQQMLHDAESGAFQYIIVYKFDRFARNRFESMMIKHQLKEKCGVKVLSALEPVTDDEGGELYEMFVEWNDEKYSQRLSVRIRDGLTTSVENGTFTGSKLIFGYKLIDTDKTGKKGTIHKVAIDEKQAEIVRFVYTEYAKGTDKKDIAAALNARGERFNGKPFKGRTFDRWLTNAKYTGEYYFGGRLCANTYPPIIDKLLFAEVQKRLAKNKILAGANSAVEPYLLTGKAYCGHCGTAIVADGGTSCNGKKHYYYACKQKKKGLCHKSRENKDNLEMQVAQAVKDFLSDKKNADRAAADTIAYYEQRTGDNGLRSIETRITQAQQEVENLTNAFIEAKSALLRAGIEKKMQDYETLLADLQAQKSQIELERGRQVTKQQILAFIAELIKGDPADKEYQKKIIDNLVFQVFVYDDEHIKTVGYLNFGVDKSIEKVRLDETNELIQRLNLCSNSFPATPPVSTEFVQHKDGIYFRQRCRGLCGIQVKQESNGFSVALLLYRTCFIIISHTITLYRRQKKLSHQKKTDYHLHILRGRIYFLNCIPGYHDFCAYPAIKNRHLTGRCRTIILIPWTSVSRRTKIGQFYRTISSSGLTQCVGGIIIEEKLCRISAIPALSTRCAAWKRRQKYKEERVCLKTYIKTSASAACACR